MSSNPINPRTAVDYRKRVCKAMNHINAHLERDLPLEEIARVAAFSEFHFHRIFKAVVGETVAAFTRRLRLERAANHLIGDPLAEITTIALACGFSSSQNFAKAFRQHFGTTPSAYRKSKRGNKLGKTENALSLTVAYTPDTVLMNPSTHERSMAMKAEIKELPEYTVAYVRKVGPYSQATCEPAFAELCQWPAPPGTWAKASFWGSTGTTPR